MIAERLLAFTLLGAGWVLWLLLALSVLSVAVMVERAIYFGSRRMSALFPRLLELCLKGDLKAAAALATSDSMEAEVVRAAAVASPGGNLAVEKAVQSTIDRRRLEYEKWLFVLGTLGNNAPFIGLFGTVLGIIRAFADLAAPTRAPAAARLVRDGGHLGGAGGHRGGPVRGHSRGARLQHLPAAFEARDRPLQRAGQRHRLRPARPQRGRMMAGGAGDSDDESITGINVTPLVDVALVLLIIFMVTASYIVKETIEVELPRAAHGGETVQKTFAVLVTREGKAYLNGVPVDDAALSNTFGGGALAATTSRRCLLEWLASPTDPGKWWWGPANVASLEAMGKLPGVTM